jgi:hypothetical protein
MARALEGATLFLAAAAYVAHVLAHHEDTRELLTRSILVSAFALWGLVQIAPGLPGNAVLGRFQRRGRAAALSEWRLINATQDLLKLHRSRLAAATS